MEELFKQLLAGQNKMDERLDRMEARQDKMDERFDKIEARLERIEGRLDENTQLIRGLMYNVETLGVEVDGLKVTTLTKESIAHLATKEDIAAIANV